MEEWSSSASYIVTVWSGCLSGPIPICGLLPTEFQKDWDHVSCKLACACRKAPKECFNPPKPCFITFCKFSLCNSVSIVLAEPVNNKNTVFLSLPMWSLALKTACANKMQAIFYLYSQKSQITICLRGFYNLYRWNTLWSGWGKKQNKTKQETSVRTTEGSLSVGRHARCHKYRTQTLENKNIIIMYPIYIKLYKGYMRVCKSQSMWSL